MMAQAASSTAFIFLSVRGRSGRRRENRREIPLTEKEASELRDLIRDLGVTPSVFDGVRDHEGRFQGYVHFTVPSEDAARVIDGLRSRTFHGRRIKARLSERNS